MLWYLRQLITFRRCCHSKTGTDCPGEIAAVVAEESLYGRKVGNATVVSKVAVLYGQPGIETGKLVPGTGGMTRSCGRTGRCAACLIESAVWNERYLRCALRSTRGEGAIRDDEDEQRGV